MEISISTSTDQQSISVKSPYHADFVGRARAMGGKWSGATKSWVFDAAAEEPVRAMLRDVYGTDGSDEQLGISAPVTLYVYTARTLTQSIGPLALDCGITLARAFGRDSGAKLGASVALLRGPKPTSGGSMKNWRTEIPSGCLLAVYNVPRGLAERALTDEYCICAIGDGTESAESVLASMQHTAAVAGLANAEKRVRSLYAERRTMPATPFGMNPLGWTSTVRGNRRNTMARAVESLRTLRADTLATVGVR